MKTTTYVPPERVEIAETKAKPERKSKANGEDTFHEIGVGLSWFLGEDGSAGNHAKFSIDLNYLPNGTPAATGLDYLASPGENQIVLRTQFQLWL